MIPMKIHDTVGGVVTRHPNLSRVFEQMKIDYCCGGGQTIAEACRAKGLAPEDLVAKLEAAVSIRDDTLVDAAAMTLTELADHIVRTHHAFLREEFPRLDGLTEKVASVHGDHEPRLHQVRETHVALRDELVSHMSKEEQILFPMVRKLEVSTTPPAFPCGSLANPIRQMEREHEVAGSALEKLRELTDDFTLPEWGCNTYRALLDALARLEADLHQHIHKENNILFPRALELESKLGA